MSDQWFPGVVYPQAETADPLFFDPRSLGEALEGSLEASDPSTTLPSHFSEYSDNTLLGLEFQDTHDLRHPCDPAFFPDPQFWNTATAGYDTTSYPISDTQYVSQNFQFSYSVPRFPETWSIFDNQFAPVVGASATGSPGALTKPPFDRESTTTTSRGPTRQIPRGRAHASRPRYVQ